ncbi:hypothetical protein OIV83_002233 [Microbotryomycetes sp. JL201]|nr:hypothetical protein OIV83_002233 [Microbotryomycetes sp. JL201]
MGLTRYDPIGVFKQLGFDTTLYNPKSAPWGRFPELAVKNFVLVTVLSIWFYGALRLQKGAVRTIAAWVGTAVLLTAPSEYGFGRSGVGIIDFGMPAWGFLAFLHIVDAFFLRPREEVLEWSFFRTAAQLFAYPNEHNPSPNPRMANIQALKLCFYKYIAVNILFYAVPPPHIWSQIKPLSVPFFMHAGVVALVILGTLGFLIESILRGLGVVLGIEMSPLFNNPMAASNIRGFWARWNLAVKDGLSRVFFHFKAPPSKKSDRASASSTAVANGKANGSANGLRRRAPHQQDYLSETEVSDGGNSTPATSPRSQPKDLIKEKTSKKLPLPSKRKRSGFLSKAFAASITFLASGLFHEYMNHLAFDGATGETVGFFLAHAGGTIAYSYIKRTAPGVTNRIPTWLGVVLVNIFAFGTAPLFCAVFIRKGFFEHLKVTGMFGKVDGFVWLAGDGYGKHLPKFAKKTVLEDVLTWPHSKATYNWAKFFVKD